MSTALTQLHHHTTGQGRGGSKKESFSLRVSPALHPPERPSPRRADMADHGLGRETRERKYSILKAILNIKGRRLCRQGCKGHLEGIQVSGKVHLTFFYPLGFN